MSNFSRNVRDVTSRQSHDLPPGYELHSREDARAEDQVGLRQEAAHALPCHHHDPRTRHRQDLRGTQPRIKDGALMIMGNVWDISGIDDTQKPCGPKLIYCVCT